MKFLSPSLFFSSQQYTSEAKEILKCQCTLFKFSLAYRFTALGENSISFYLIFILCFPQTNEWRYFISKITLRIDSSC